MLFSKISTFCRFMAGFPADHRAVGTGLQTQYRRHARSPVAGPDEALWDAGAVVQAFDPEAMEETQAIYGTRDDLILCGTREAALRKADALVVVTDWQEFKAPDFEVIKSSLNQPVIFDGRNLYDPARLAKRGFTYYGIGRGSAVSQG